MATKPTFKPEWALNDTTLPVAGTDNKIRPTIDLRNNGIDYGQQLTAQEFNWILENIKEWIDYLEDVAGTEDAFVATGTADAAVVAANLDAYTSEDVYWVDWPGTSTVTNPTLNINGLGAITILSVDGDTLEAGDLEPRIYPFWYDGTNFRVATVLKASQADALAHTDNKQWMTALRTFQAFSQYGLGATTVPRIADFNNSYTLETGFYTWDTSTTGEPSSGTATGEPTAFIINENNVSTILAIGNGDVYTNTSTSSTTLGSWKTFTADYDWDTNSNLVTTGHQILPSGLIMQWGSTGLTSVEADSVYGPFSFDITFPNGRPFYIGLIIEKSVFDTSGGLASYTRGITDSQFSIQTDQDVAGGNGVDDIRWFAVGY